MKDKITRLAPILLIIVIAILAIAALVSVGQMFFSESKPEEKPTQTQAVEEEKDSILKSDANRSVKMTVRGPIVANEDFRSYTIHVTPAARTLTTFKGYEDEVIDNVSLPNNTSAYEEFTFALNRANMMKGEALSGSADDLRGICATGHIYEFAILKDGKVEKRLWTSTCEGSRGSLKANTRQLQNLFMNQIPNNSQVVKDLGIANI